MKNAPQRKRPMLSQPAFFGDLFGRDGVKAAEDVVRFHFASFDCLCLRCGAVFDGTAESKEGLSPG